MMQPNVPLRDESLLSGGETPVETMSLGLVAEIAALMRHGDGLDDVLTGTVSALCRAWRNRDCRVWVRGRDGESYRPYSGRGVPGPPTAVAEGVRTWLLPSEEYDNSLSATRMRVPLVQNGDRLGVLEVTVPSGPVSAIHRQIVDVVAGMLGSYLAVAKYAAKHAALGSVAPDSGGQATQDLTEEIVDSLPVGLYVIDRDYRVLTWNRQRETGTLVDREHAVGRSIFEILRRMDADRLREEFDTVFRTGRAEQVDVESTHTGEPRHHRITKIPMRVGGGDVSHVITIAEDLTEWMSMQQQHVVLAEKLGAVGQLAAGVMHELNNPLATIGACVEALSLRTPPLADPVRTVFDEYLRIIESELERCQAIIDGLLDFSRPTSRQKRLCDINRIVDDALFLVKHHDKFRRITLVRQLADGVPWVEANTEQLIQVFVALMLNAIDAMEGTGSLTVTSQRNPENDSEVAVHVSDSGMGIPVDRLPRIFEPFFTSKQPGQGTGLGLAICYSIVAQHRGRIDVDSIVDQGSTFTVLLPAASREE